MSNNKYRTSTAYLAIKNYLHNECGLTKEEVKQAALQGVKDAAAAEVQRYLQKEGPNMLEKHVTAVLKDTLVGNWHSRNEFREELLKKASAVIANQLNLVIKT